MRLKHNYIFLKKKCNAIHKVVIYTTALLALLENRIFTNSIFKPAKNFHYGLPLVGDRDLICEDYLFLACC